MSSEPEKSGEEIVWSMPNPVFRSTDGKDLRAGPDKNGEAETPSAKDTENIMENDPKQIAEATTDPHGENALGKHDRGDKLSISMTAIGLLSLLVVGILFLLFYFLVFQTGNPGSP